jgi:hypothetical protein
MNNTTGPALLLSLLLAGTAHADDTCSAYMMDVGAEIELFREIAAPLQAGRRADDAPAIEAGKLYAVRLHSQKDVTYAAPRTGKPADPQQSGGMLKVTVAETGKYRISSDANFWIDAVADGVALTTLDFRSNRECAGPRKIVTYQLPAGVELVVQLIDAGAPLVRVTLTPVPQEPW